VNGDDALKFDDPEQLCRWLDEVEPLLLRHMREGVDG
jgi:hypothetical protein